MRSSWSLGPLYIAVGALAVSPLGARGPLTPAAIVLAALLIVAGVVLLTKRGFAYWLAIPVAVVVALSGVVAQLGHPQWTLLSPPWMPIVLGGYLTVRTLMARTQANTPSRFIPPLPGDDDGKPSASGDGDGN